MGGKRLRRWRQVLDLFNLAGTQKKQCRVTEDGGRDTEDGGRQQTGSTGRNREGQGRDAEGAGRCMGVGSKWQLLTCCGASRCTVTPSSASRAAAGSGAAPPPAPVPPPRRSIRARIASSRSSCSFFSFSLARSSRCSRALISTASRALASAMYLKEGEGGTEHSHAEERGGGTLPNHQQPPQPSTCTF